MYCPRCGAEIPDTSLYCSDCGASLTQGGNYGLGRRSRTIAGLLALFTGAYGIHNFYLGNKKRGIIQLCLGIGGLVTFGITSAISGIWGICEAISIFLGKINADGDGNPLAN